MFYVTYWNVLRDFQLVIERLQDQEDVTDGALTNYGTQARQLQNAYPLPGNLTNFPSQKIGTREAPRSAA